MLVAWAFSSCSKWGLLLVAVHGLLIVLAFLVSEPPRSGGFSSCSTWTLEHALSNCDTGFVVPKHMESSSAAD